MITIILIIKRAVIIKIIKLQIHKNNGVFVDKYNYWLS